MKKKKARTLLFRALPIIVAIMAFLSSCENDSLVDRPTVGDLDTGPLSIEGFDLEIDPDNYGSLVSGDGETRLYRTTISHAGTGAPVKDPYFSFYVQVGAEGERTVLKAVPNDLGGSFSLEEKANTFNGTVVEYASNGAPGVLKVYDRGTLIDESPLQGMGKGRDLAGREYWEPLIYWDDPNHGGGGYVSIFVERYTDMYFDRNNNGTAEPSEYGYSRYNGGGWEYVQYGSNEYVPITNDTFHRHDRGPGRPSTAQTHNNENFIIPPSCESFNYSRVGTTNWQCAPVSGVHELFIVFNWKCIGYDWGIFTQPLYFQLPINNNFSLDSGSTKIESAAYLDMAFKAFDNWYKINGCNAGGAALEQKLLEYIKDEFEENGGAVTLNPPLGFVGSPTAYKVTWSGYGNCD